MEMRAAYAECLAKFMEEDKHVVVLDADLAKASGTRKLYDRFPEQMFDCGVAEQDMASIAAGLASYGFKPWIESFTPFATRRICDQITISISYAKQNVKIVGTDPGISAELNGGTHMSMEDVGVVRSIPGMVIFEPVDAAQLRAAMPVLNAYEGPVYMRLFRKALPDVFGEGYKFDLFKADLLREGKDLSIFVSGFLTKDALEVADQLAAEGNGSVLSFTLPEDVEQAQVYLYHKSEDLIYEDKELKEPWHFEKHEAPHGRAFVPIPDEAALFYFCVAGKTNEGQTLHAATGVFRRETWDDAETTD